MHDYLNWLAKTVTLLVLVLVGIPALLIGAISFLSGIEHKKSDPSKTVGVITLDDEIADTTDVLKKLYEFAGDEDVQGIVLRIDSPGGAVAPSQDIYSAVKKLKEKKPIVASMGSVAASGGLYVALSASKIFCQPGTLTGSIGVILQFPNLTKIADKVGFNMITVKSGELKDIGNPFRNLAETDRTFLQSTVMKAYDDFIKDVADGRKIPLNKVKSFADGRVILGREAKELGLVDEFGDVYDAARAVFDLKKAPLKVDEMPELYYATDAWDELRQAMKSISHLPRIASRIGLQAIS